MPWGRLVKPWDVCVQVYRSRQIIPRSDAHRPTAPEKDHLRLPLAMEGQGSHNTALWSNPRTRWHHAGHVSLAPPDPSWQELGPCPHLKTYPLSPPHLAACLAPPLGSHRNPLPPSHGHQPCQPQGHLLQQPAALPAQGRGPSCQPRPGPPAAATACVSRTRGSADCAAGWRVGGTESDTITNSWTVQPVFDVACCPCPALLPARTCPNLSTC